MLEEVIAEIETRVFTSMAKGDAVVGRGSRRRWLHSKQSQIRFEFWNRYSKYLHYDRDFSPGVITTLDASLSELLELLGDPHDESGYFRRGLIVGDVQSGKTATYIGLCSKAADAGYKIIILLAGHMNSLRYQTQERLDEGFVGRDSQLVGKEGGQASLLGAAKYGPGLFVHQYTTKLHDFDTQAAQSAGSPLAGLKGPALLVVKKNKTILQNMYQWLRSLNPVNDGKIKSSLLLIDDEADFASVNTGTEYDPKAINRGIRKLLGLFDKASYVGVTATPFANVFIAPDSQSDMYGQDLFPDDYIYSLEPPSNYIGAQQVFDEDLESTVRTFSDAEPIMPLKHNKHHVVSELPNSLEHALHMFMLSNAIRDQRLEGTSHRSMLVNVSPNNAVQAQVTSLLRERLTELLRDLLVFGGLKASEARKQSKVVALLQDSFESDYGQGPIEQKVKWEALLPALYDANRDVLVQTVNMSSKVGLNYDKHADTGLRVIAVGGHSLSRGLTLEGLCVSYFHRNSKAYDTLLQMARWFGYRPRYRDLCRVFMTDEAVANYQFISEAVTDLKSQFQHMREIEATPAEFGLKVRASPAGLLMTAASKMKTAKKVMLGNVSLSTRRLEATQLDASEASLRSNEIAVDSLVRDLASTVPDTANALATQFWGEQPKELVIKLLEAYRVHPILFSFRPGEIAHYLKMSSLHALEKWDICFRTGSDSVQELYGLPIKPSRRTVFRSGDVKGMFTIGEQKSRRLGSGEDDKIGLGEEELEILSRESSRVASQGTKPNVGYLARLVRRRPLLTMYVIRAEKKVPNAFMPPVNPFTVICLTFPDFVDADIPEQEIVLANPIWQQYEDGLRADVDEDDLEMNQE
jgi:hypothetical protein